MRAIGKATVPVFIFLMLAGLLPSAYAHYTVGRPIGGPPFRLHDFDVQGHVPGVTGYVWPGGGLPFLDPTNPIVQGPGVPFTAFPPGYQNPFTPFGPPTPQPTELSGNTYSPFSSILTSTVDHLDQGDLIIAINFTCPQTGGGCNGLTSDFNFTTIAIYVPPEFKPPVDWSTGDTSNIVTTTTNDYHNILVHENDGLDAFGPYWWGIFIRAHLSFLKIHNYSEWYYFRLNDLTAPYVAGTYFFKIFLNSTFPTRSTVSDTGAVSPILGVMPAENWPILLVKGEDDPAIMAGTIRYGGFNQSLYNRPVQMSGRVRLVGVATNPITGISTGRQVEAWGFFNASARGRYEVEGIAPGEYQVYASAAGFPDQLVAKNVVFHPGQPVFMDFQLNIGPTISGELFSKRNFADSNWLNRRPVFIQIFDDNTWQDLGELAWQQTHLKTFSPINLTSSPYTSYVVGNTVWTTSKEPFDTPPTPKRAAFPWEGPTSYYSFTSGVTPKDPFGVSDGVGPAQVWWVDPAGLPTTDADPTLGLGSTPTTFRWQFGEKGVYGVPATYDGHVPQVLATWTGGLSSGTYYLRAWVTQYLQTDVNGNFVDYQFTVSGGEFAGDVFVPVDLRLGGSLNVTVHFHNVQGTIKDSPIQGPDPGRYLLAEAYDPAGDLMGFNFTYLGSGNSTGTIALDGFGMAGPNNFISPGGAGIFGMRYSLYRYRHIADYGLPSDTYSIRIYMRGYLQESTIEATVALNTPTLVSASMNRGGGLNVTVFSEDYEYPSVPEDWVWPSTPVFIGNWRSDGTKVGLVHIWNGMAWVIPTQSSGQSSLPFRGASFSLVFNGSIGLETVGPDSIPIISPFEVEEEFAANVEALAFVSGFLWNFTLYRDIEGFSAVALPEDVYSVHIHTYGYIQRNASVVFSSPGSLADVRLDAVVGLNLTFTLKFEIQNVLAANPFNMSMRVRVYNDLGELVAASTTSESLPPPFPTAYAPSNVSEVVWKLAGFSSYVDINHVRYDTYGITAMPDYLGGWTVEVDTVNWYLPHAFFPLADGLLLGESFHTIGQGFGLTGSTFAFNNLGPWQQNETLRIPNGHLSGEASAIFSLRLRGLVRGVILGTTYLNQLRPISWVQINFTEATYYVNFTQHSLDGFYEEYLNPGDYHVYVVEWTTSGQGHGGADMRVVVSEGSRLSTLDTILQRTGIPISELSYGPSVVLLAVLILALMPLRVKRSLHVHTRRRRLT